MAKTFQTWNKLGKLSPRPVLKRKTRFIEVAQFPVAETLTFLDSCSSLSLGILSAYENIQTSIQGKINFNLVPSSKRCLWTPMNDGGSLCLVSGRVWLLSWGVGQISQKPSSSVSLQQHSCVEHLWEIGMGERTEKMGKGHPSWFPKYLDDI